MNASRANPQQSHDTKLIAVLGVTGAGKSTFINRAAGSNLTVGHSTDSCTEQLAYVPMQLDGQSILLIDTPGFDDTNRTDADILEGIAIWLGQTHAAGHLLTGVILLQPITVNRGYGSERTRTRLFKKICGDDAFSHVIIASTMWSELTSQQTGEQRVQDRKKDKAFWADMVDQGAEVVNHADTTASAHNIIRLLLPKKPKVLQMQTELKRHDGQLKKTAAGAQLAQDLGAMREEEQRKYEKLLSDKNREREEMREQMEKLKDQIAKTEAQREKVQQVRVDRERWTDGSGPEWVTALATLGGVAVTAAPLLLAAPFFCSLM